MSKWLYSQLVFKGHDPFYSAVNIREQVIGKTVLLPAAAEIFHR